MASKKKNPDGNVMIPLGDDKKELEQLAKSVGLKAGPLAKLYVLHGIKRHKAGKFGFQAPAIVEKGGAE